MSDKIVQILQNYFKTKPVLKAYIFGSYADNSSSEQSDIDVLIDWDYKSEAVNYDLFYTMSNELNQLLKKKVDLVSSNGLSKFIAPIIHKQKLLIYERSN